MTRSECLEKAARCVLKDRQDQYGEPENCFGMIAGMWTAYLGVFLTAFDASMMMALLKIARAKANPHHGDSLVDLAGYAACGAELAPVGRAEGCEELVRHDAPQTPEEVCRHIVDSNPATYGRPHNPTGEELAEMAREEDGDGA